MLRKRIYALIFLFFTVINIAIFIFRDHFSFQPYSSYNSLYAPCNERCLYKWKQYADDYESELKEAKQITDSIIYGETHTIKKIIAIESFIYNRFKRQMGTPSADLGASPMDQYKKLCSSDRLQLWCGNFALIAGFFCWSQGIVTRNIEILNPGNHHSLNECYVPETNSWIMTDVTHGLLAVSNREGKYLDLISFKDALKNKSALNVMRPTNDWPGVRMYALKDSLVPVQYKVDHPICYYHHVNNKKVYTKANKVKRYFLPVSWYDIYDSKNHSNLSFYLKEVFSFLWVVAFFVFLFTRTKFRA